ncbi:MAG: oligopeptide transport system substrate-binding protein [Clostridiales bacterium]|jgi:ABC-type oligopeptide transport system substrate-binding subunit|nr:oligopeptide transport system substrate-binding protein [Clostridiales bacterium]
MKRLFALVLALVLVFSLAACSSSTTTTAAATTAGAETTTEAAHTYTAEEVVQIYEVRKALTLAIDRELLVEQITRAGQLPATGFVPPGLKDSTGADFRATAGDYGIATDSSAVAEAQQLLADAGFPNGEGFPTLTILYNTSEGHQAIAEAIQEMWKQNLNINVELQNQEWAVFQDTRHQGNFEVARAGWIGDYEDPMTFLDLWTSYSGNNDAQWKVKAYDDIIEESKLASGADRDALLYEAEQMIMDDLIVMPIYYYTNPIMVKDDVKGWYLSTLGHWYFGNTTTTDGTLQWNLGSEPKTLDPGLNSAVDGGHIINNTFEGLMRKDDEGIKPAMAESYDVSEDGTVYTFHLRDAMWSDGQPVTAGDFEYAWKRALDPAVASEYGFQMFYIQGAQDYYEGNGSIDDVMVKALDDKTLEVTLAAPTPYFLDLTTFYTFMPVRQDVIEADPEGWAINPETNIGNGPFKLADYKTGDRIVLVPNENYWKADETKLTEIDAMMIVDQSTALTAYEAGELDILDDMPTSEIPRLQAEDPTFQIMPYVGTYYYIFNVGINE